MAKQPKNKSHYNYVIKSDAWWQRVKIAAQVKGLPVQAVMADLLTEWLHSVEKEIVERYTKGE